MKRLSLLSPSSLYLKFTEALSSFLERAVGRFGSFIFYRMHVCMEVPTHLFFFEMFVEKGYWGLFSSSCFLWESSAKKELGNFFCIDLFSLLLSLLKALRLA